MSFLSDHYQRTYTKYRKKTNLTARILVAYASWKEPTAGITQAIGRELEDGYTVNVSEMKSVTSIAGYKAVVIGGPVYTGKITGDVTVFVSTNKDELSGVLVAGYGHCTGIFKKTGDVKGFTDQLVTASSPVLPVAVTMFAGSIDAIKMNFDERNLTSLVKFPTGDFRDLDTIAAWERALAGKMGLQWRYG